MAEQEKYFYLVSSACPIIKVAWFIGNKFQLNLSQKSLKIGNRNLLVFEALSDDDKRISLYRTNDLSLSKLKNFDYLLVLENIEDFDVQNLRNSQYVNFITKLDFSGFSQRSKQLLSLL